VSGRRRVALLALVCAQVALPLALAGVTAADLAFGEEIRLRAQPVDPLDIFRGNYVVLRYDISSPSVVTPVSRGERVCVRLSRVGEAWTGNHAEPGPTPDGTAICGRARDDAEPGARVRVEYGVETYFANAERAREIEESIGRGQLYVVVDLDEDGSARIERIETGED
jgi:uncharacterized membrane-anchored protein